MNDNKSAHNARDYDVKVQKTIPYYNFLHTETIELVKTIKPEVTVWLDTGCGTGYLVEQGIKAFPDCIFYLSDPSAAMLDQARKRLAPYPEQVKILEAGDSATLSARITVKPQVVSSIQCHHYLSKSDREQAVAACYEVLDQEGLYITFENIRPLTDKGISYGLDRWMRFQIGMGKSIEEAAAHKKRFDTEIFPITVTDHLALLKKCGFRTVELLWYSGMQAGFYGLK